LGLFCANKWLLPPRIITMQNMQLKQFNCFLITCFNGKKSFAQLANLTGCRGVGLFVPHPDYFSKCLNVLVNLKVLIDS
jgi:hypothetical protein